MWKLKKFLTNRGKTWNLQIDEARAFVARQGENRGVHIGVDMPLAELLIEALHGTFGRVVVLAEVAQHDVFHARVIDFGHKLRRLLVAQMAKRTRNALLQNIWIKTFLQHFHIVIRLNDEVVGATDLFLHHLVKHPYVSGDGQGMSFKIKMIAYSPSSIVHHGKCLNRDAANLKRLQRLNLTEQFRIDFFRGIALCKSLQTVRVCINRDGRVFGQNLKAFHMVDMVMRDEDGLDVIDAQVIISQSCKNLLHTDAHIHQDTFILLAHKVAVAATARGKAAKHTGRKTGKKIHLSQFWAQK